MAREIIVISDIHLGLGYDHDWYQKEPHDSQLLFLLDSIKNSDNRDNIDLVLAGDVFDTWLCPMHLEPPKIHDILVKNGNIIEKLKEVVGVVNGVFFINGNHDMHVTQEDLSLINDSGKRLQCVNEYRSGLLKIEHGHRYAMFNAKDKINDPLHGLPLGYFITRILAGNETYDGPAAIASYIEDLLEAAFTTQTISSSVIEALAEFTGKHDSDEFNMPFGRQNITIREVKSKYSQLFDLWVDKFGYQYTLHSIRAEMGSLDWFADRLARKHDYRVVVMGHTHSSGVDEDKLFLRNNRVYANSGFWATKEPSYVNIKKQNGAYQVSLYKKEEGGFAAGETKEVAV